MHACIKEKHRKGYQAPNSLFYTSGGTYMPGYVNFRTEKYLGKERDHATEHQHMFTVMFHVHMYDALLKYWMHLKMIILFRIVSKT